jgi:uncharacterized BrkB/YihY/UPF0761 family membrane protein
MEGDLHLSGYRHAFCILHGTSIAPSRTAQRLIIATCYKPDSMNFISRVFGEFSEDRCPTLAAALAYYSAFALPPLLYLLLTVLTFGRTLAYGTDEAQKKTQGTVERKTAQMLGNEAPADEISTILETNKNSGGIWWKTLLSFAGIVGGATGVVAALQDSLNRVWVYYNGLILLLGAEATLVYASMYGDGIRASHDAVRVVQEVQRQGPSSEEHSRAPDH